MMTAYAAARSALFIEESRQLLIQIEQDWQQAKPAESQWRDHMLRQLHKLKGMAASFDEAAAAECCHQLETAVSQADKAFTAKQAMAISQTLGKLHEILHGLRPQTKTLADNPAQQSTAGAHQQWQIDFKPLPGFFANGQDPLQYLKQLQTLGDMTVAVDSSQLPAFADYEANQPYLSWRIQLNTTADAETIKQVFDWVKADCQLAITLLNQQIEAPQPALPRHEPVRHILRRHQQQTSWLDELQQQADILPLALQNRLDQIQLAQTQNYLALQKLMLRPLLNAYQRLPALLNTIGSQTGKQAALTLPEQPLWVPSQLLELISDVLIQLLRNALAHGVETVEQRLAAGKPATGNIRIEQSLDGMQLNLLFADDGAGLQAAKILAAAGQQNGAEISELIFQAGLSTASTPDLLSGRGIGLDLVRQHIQQLQGTISVSSTEGEGCVFQISLPLRQTVQTLQAVEVADQLYVLSAENIVEDLPAESLKRRHISGRGEFVEFQQQWLPVWDLRQRFKLANSVTNDPRLLIIRSHDIAGALQVDKCRLPAEFLLNDLQSHYRQVPGIPALASDGGPQVALWLQPDLLFGKR